MSCEACYACVLYKTLIPRNYFAHFLMITVSPTLSLQEEEIVFKFIRASGPGGQHVNKTSSAVQLWFDAASSPAISHAMLKRLREKAGQKLSADGVLTLRAELHSSQHRNKEDAVERLINLLRASEKPPKHRRKTRPTKASNLRRLDTKARTKTKKQSRGKVSFHD